MARPPCIFLRHSDDAETMSLIVTPQRSEVAVDDVECRRRIIGVCRAVARQSARRWTAFLTTVAAVAAAAMLLLAARGTGEENHSSPSEAASSLQDATELAPVRPIVCGAESGASEVDLNDLGTNLQTMTDAGWRFSDHWSPKSKYRPNLDGESQLQMGSHGSSSSAYWGWDYPGVGYIQLDLLGSGTASLDYGNAYSSGIVGVSYGHGHEGALVDQASPKTASKITRIRFTNGGWIRIEEKARAIIVINSVSFDCGDQIAIDSAEPPRTSTTAKPHVQNVSTNLLGPVPAAARKQKQAVQHSGDGSHASKDSAASFAAAATRAPTPSPTPLEDESSDDSESTVPAARYDIRGKEGKHLYISGAQWILDTADTLRCGETDATKACLVEHQEGVPWGTPEAVSYRTWCATACLLHMNSAGVDDCVAFVYPSPGDQGEKQDVCYMVSQNCTADKPHVCGFTLGDTTRWDYYQLKNRVPDHYPDLERSTN